MLGQTNIGRVIKTARSKGTAAFGAARSRAEWHVGGSEGEKLGGYEGVGLNPVRLSEHKALGTAACLYVAV